MNPITRIAPVTDEEAARMARPGTLSDLGRQITATPIAASNDSSARGWAPTKSWRLPLAGALAAGLAATVVIVAGGVPGARHNGTGTTAYVVERVDSALSAADPAEIAQVTITPNGAATAGGTTMTAIAEEWSYGDRWRVVTYSAAGHPVDEDGSNGSSPITEVSYPTRTWARQHVVMLGPSPRPRACETFGEVLPFLFVAGSGGESLPTVPAHVASDLRTAISCGTLVVAGRQRVDGVEAIKLASRQGSLISETIWVSPGTYLPVRLVVRSSRFEAVRSETADITWLKPTARNLDKLTVRIPAGFRQVRSLLP
jgi:hypothetical protein